MVKKWKLIDEILTNTYNDQLRDITPISNDDKQNIVQLDEMEALMLWNTYFSETAKYALRFERTYGEPIMTEIFDESDINADMLRKTLKSMYSNETPILIYWSMNMAIKTTWGMFIKYWDNFFYSAGDEAIIYVNPKDIYIYTDMIVRKINELKPVSEVSAFDYLKKLGDEKEKKLYAFENLFNGISNDLQSDLYLIFHQMCDGLRVLENEELRKEYLEYYKGKIISNTTNAILVCKPYSEESKKDYYKFLEDSWNKSQEDKFLGLLKKIIK